MVRRGQEQIGQIVQHFAVPEKDLAPSERVEQRRDGLGHDCRNASINYPFKG